MPSLEVVTTIDVRDEASSSENVLFDVDCEEMLESKFLRGDVGGDEEEEEGSEANNEDW